MADADTVQERLAQLLALEEDRFIAGFHQKVQKAREKSWHDRHVKNKIFQIGYLVLLYDSKFVKFPGKFKTHWLGPYQIQQVTGGGDIQLSKLNGELLPLSLMEIGLSFTVLATSYPSLKILKRSHKRRE